jgi:beta-lactamase regulating signal transducer with metallopeptidase domain
MSAFLILRALLFAGECLLASVALPLAGFAITALLRRAALRHLVWTTLFGVLAVLPLVAWLMPPRLIVRHVAAMPVQAVTEAVAAPPAAAAPLPPDLLAPGNIVALLLTLWLAGLFWQVLRLALGGIGLRRLAKASTPFASEIETGCAIRLARDESGPATFGLLRPVVLLPRSAEHWPAARLEAVLRHEAAHVARRDVLSQFIARLVCAVFWINPLLWLGYGALRRQAEIAADDAVVAGGMTPSLYAIELVRLAGESLRPVPGIAMARPPLTKRVEAVLAENSLRKGVTKMDMAKMGLLGLTATLLLGAARFDLAVAQDAPAPKLERNLDRTITRNVDNDVSVEVNAAEVKAKAEAGRAKADAERMAADARKHVAEARRMDGDVQRAMEAQAAAVKAQADVNLANARAQAAAATDPAQKALFRRIADEKAAEAAVTKANADLAVAQARRNADGARQSDSEFQRAAMARSETALARTQEALARQAQARARDKADPGKQQLMQLMADSVAVARQEMAQARARAEADTRSAMGDVSRADKVTFGNTTFSGNVQMQQTKPGGPITFTADKMDRDMGPPGNRYVNSGDGVQVDVQLGPVAMGDALARHDVMDPLNATITMAVAEARKKISAAIDAARIKAGLPPVPKSAIDFQMTNTGNLPVPPAARAIPAPPVPPRAPLPPVPTLPN